MRATSPSSGCDAAVRAHRHDTQIVEAGHPRLRHLDLHLERDAGARVGPVVRRDEPARRRRRGERSTDLVDGDTELPGHLAVHVHLNRRVVERLSELQIAQRRNPARARPAPSSANARLAAKSGPVIGDFDRRGRAEVHDPADDVAGLERELRRRKPVVETAAQRLLELAEPTAAPRA